MLCVRGKHRNPRSFHLPSFVHYVEELQRAQESARRFMLDLLGWSQPMTSSLALGGRTRGALKKVALACGLLCVLASMSSPTN